jgi:hypothetical protein
VQASQLSLQLQRRSHLYFEVNSPRAFYVFAFVFGCIGAYVRRLCAKHVSYYCMHASICLCSHICLKSEHICVLCMCIYIYIYIYIHIHTAYICTYIRTDVYT